MPEAVRVLCAVRERSDLIPLMRELDDGEHCTFDVVTTGTQAIEACLRSAPDILVIDAVLPGIDGLGVVERLGELLGGRMPAVIGGARTPFAREGFLRRGACAIVDAPWKKEMILGALRLEAERRNTQINWGELLALQHRAGDLLLQMGMHASLKGFDYLCSAAALAYTGEQRMFAIGKDLYQPVAEYHHTSAQSVERLIRHAIESTMNAARAKGVYSLFGNTIDPAKGKPTNAQVIAMLVQNMRVARERECLCANA